MKKLIIYEINEIPWEVVDLYISKRPNSALKNIIEQSHCFTTKTVDSGELHPWSTWPTMHRGVSNDVHNIRYLNQDLSESDEHPPLWEILLAEGINVGIVGSLNSYPPITDDQMVFHVPDTFSVGPETVPNKYMPFQKFNLKQTRANVAVAGKVNYEDGLAVLGLLKSGIKPRTFFQLFKQLATEKIHPLQKTRRSLFQALLAFDVLKSCLRRAQPGYVAFFSNHVAGIMHRYWKYSFPHEFDYVNTSSEDFFYEESLLVAMDLFDNQLRYLMKYADKNNYSIVICSSMGQEAIDRGQYIEEPLIENFDLVMKAIGFTEPYKHNLAMYPDIALEFEDKRSLDEFYSKIEKLTDTDNKILFKKIYEPVGLTINISVAGSRTLMETKEVKYDNRTIKSSEFGMKFMNRHAGTAYHKAEGILIWQDKQIDRDKLQQKRNTVDSRQFAPSVLKNYRVSKPDYMMAPIL